MTFRSIDFNQAQTPASHRTSKRVHDVAVGLFISGSIGRRVTVGSTNYECQLQLGETTHLLISVQWPVCTAGRPPSEVVPQVTYRPKQMSLMSLRFLSLISKWSWWTMEKWFKIFDFLGESGVSRIPGDPRDICLLTCVVTVSSHSPNTYRTRLFIHANLTIGVNVSVNDVCTTHYDGKPANT